MKISIFNWNLNGIRALLKKQVYQIDTDISINFEEFVTANNFTIVSLQETKINDIHLIDHVLPDYNYRYSTVTKNSRSGVTVLSKLKALHVTYDLNVSNNLQFKGRCVHLEFDIFHYIAVYQPNSGAGLKTLKFRTEEWDPKFKEYLEKIRNGPTAKELIISGDFNVVQNELGSYNFKQQRNKIAGVTDIEMYNFKVLTHALDLEIVPNKRFTYFTYLFKSRESGKGMLIDYFLVTAKLFKKVKKMEVLSDVYGSDHIPLLLEIEV